MRQLKREHEVDLIVDALACLSIVHDREGVNSPKGKPVRPMTQAKMERVKLKLLNAENDMFNNYRQGLLRNLVFKRVYMQLRAIRFYPKLNP